MLNIQLAKVLYEMADLLEMEGVPFKPVAYSRAARLVEALSQDISEIYQREGLKGLERLEGIGKGIASRVEEFIKTGKIADLEKMKKRSPIDVEELNAVEGVGPKTMRKLYDELKVRTLSDLEKAAKAGKIRKLPHFGEKTEANILRGIEFLKKGQGRMLLGTALPIAREIEKRLRSLPGVGKAITAGSVRRRQETIGDIDVLVTAKNPSVVMDYFVSMPEVETVYGKGETKTSVRLSCGLDADIRVVPEESYGAALQYFTGSKEHNVAVRKIAAALGYKLNEYGLFQTQNSKLKTQNHNSKLKTKFKRIAGATEEEIYQALGLAWIPPELRTATGEIEAARIISPQSQIRSTAVYLPQVQRKIRSTAVYLPPGDSGGQAPALQSQGGLPHLIELKDIKGDLQLHTVASDGVGFIGDMARQARELGYEYLAITDHTKSLGIARGLDEAGILKQMKEIEEANRKSQTRLPAGRAANRGLHILKSAEVNILPDGNLDIADEVLVKLDFVGVAVHSRMKISKDEMTKRVCRALKNPLVHALFHPTGRLINRREPYSLDLDEVFKIAAKYKKALEINAYPLRLDLKDTDIRRAKEYGVKFIISTDSHSPEGMNCMELGVFQARRGWCEKKDILNALPLTDFLSFLRRGLR
jgi:DNA polymerase (family 10)